VAEPIFWLGVSILLVAVCLAAVLVAALPALQELARAARSIEKLADTLNRELPPTLEAIRLTGLEISDLTDDISGGVQNASSVARQVDQGLSGARQQAKEVKVTTRSVVAGFKAAWRTWTRPDGNRRKAGRGGRLSNSDRSERLSGSERLDFSYREYSILRSEADLPPAEDRHLETLTSEQLAEENAVDPAALPPPASNSGES
jgi:uncharacterized protein YoxC